MAGRGELTLRVILDEFDEAVREVIAGLDDELIDRLAERIEQRIAERGRRRGELRIP